MDNRNAINEYPIHNKYAVIIIKNPKLIGFEFGNYCSHSTIQRNDNVEIQCLRC